MGVDRLTKYLTTHCRRSFGTTSWMPTPTADPLRTVVVDLSAFAHHLAHNVEGTKVGHLLGGEWGVLARRTRDYVKAFQRVGATLVFVADGSYAAATGPKRATLDARLEQREKEALELRADFAKRPRVVREAEAYKHGVPARFITSVVADAVRALGCEVVCADGEADPVVAFEAQARSAYVLTNDSDALCAPIPACKGVVLLSEWTQPTLAPSGAVTFKHLEPRALAATLDFPPELLPLFAAASGNDEVDTGALATLHREAMREERARRKATWYAHQPSADDKVKIVAARQAFKDGKVRAKHHLPCRKNAHCNKPMCPYKHPGDSQYLCWHDEDNGLNYCHKPISCRCRHVGQVHDTAVPFTSKKFNQTDAKEPLRRVLEILGSFKGDGPITPVRDPATHLDKTTAYMTLDLKDFVDANRARLRLAAHGLQGGVPEEYRQLTTLGLAARISGASANRRMRLGNGDTKNVPTELEAAVAALARGTDVPPALLREAVRAYTPVPRRSGVVEGIDTGALQPSSEYGATTAISVRRDKVGGTTGEARGAALGARYEAVRNAVLLADRQDVTELDAKCVAASGAVSRARVAVDPARRTRHGTTLPGFADCWSSGTGGASGCDLLVFLGVLPDDAPHVEDRFQVFLGALRFWIESAPEDPSIRRLARWEVDGIVAAAVAAHVAFAVGRPKDVFYSLQEPTTEATLTLLWELSATLNKCHALNAALKSPLSGPHAALSYDGPIANTLRAWGHARRPAPLKDWLQAAVRLDDAAADAAAALAASLTAIVVHGVDPVVWAPDERPAAAGDAGDGDGDDDSVPDAWDDSSDDEDEAMAAGAEVAAVEEAGVGDPVEAKAARQACWERATGSAGAGAGDGGLPPPPPK